ncbi:MAG: PEGA domain-containing protein, partial [Myxococcales bacterium]|nr:PEGA domain-containing protein [Myxococcales bacterium]
MALSNASSYTGAMTCPARLLLCAVGLAVLTITPGCATLLRAERAVLPVASLPPGAEVSLDGVPKGKTPIDV